MKSYNTNIIFTLFLLIGSCFISFSQENHAKLEIKAFTNDVTTVGEPVRISMSILDPHLEEVVASEEYVTISSPGIFKTNSQNTFVYTFHVLPEDTGITQIGPFTLKYRDKTLVSNVITLQVREAKEKICLLTQVRSGVKAGNEGEVKFISHGLDISGLQLQTTGFMEVLTSSYATSIAFKDGKQEKKYTKTFKVVFTKQGRFKITDDLIGEYSAYFCTAPIEVTIK